MKITVVVDNYLSISDSRHFLGEHGFSLLIEIGTKKFLMDTGQSDVVLKNLGLIGVHPNQLDAIVLSHGHYDHTGGLRFILQRRDKPIPVYGHPDMFQKHSSIKNGNTRYIGIPGDQDELSALGASWQFSNTPLEIAPNLLFSGQIPRQTEYELGDEKLTLEKENQCECKDIITDDTSLYYTHLDGLVVIGGCTHAGFVNTVEYGLAITGNRHLSGWVGGTHLGPAAKLQQDKTLGKIDEYAPRFFAASHCTGFTMMAELQRRLGQRYIPSFVGQVIEIN